MLVSKTVHAISISYLFYSTGIDVPDFPLSVLKSGSQCIEVTQCRNSSCSAPACHGEKYHCPLCETVDCVQDFPSLGKRHLNGVHYKKTINVGGKMFKSCILFIASMYFVCSKSTSCFAAKKLLSFTK